MRSLSYHKYIMVIGYWCWGRWKRWPQLKQSNMKEKIRHWAQNGKWVGLESGSNFGSGQSVSKSGTFEKRGMEVCSTQDLPWDSTNATVLWSSSLFSSFIKITRFCPKSQSWDLCNALQCLTCTDMWVLGRVCKGLISGKLEDDEVVMVLKNEKLH